MPPPYHKELLKLIRENSGKPTRHTFLDSYLGNDHIKYPIDNPTLRLIAKEWMRAHRDLTPEAFSDLLTSLIEGESCTEKMLAGIMMGYSTKAQRDFDPAILDHWLDYLVGWVEVDTLCTGDFITSQLPANWTTWRKVIIKLSRDNNINKRRASLVLFCSPLGRVKNDAIAETALQVIERLKHEKPVLITKAISWVLRSMIKHHRLMVEDYLDENRETLPKIAVRETVKKLDTGRKSGKVN